MRILLLGGTVFLGRAVTDAALAAGHALTHFHRGKSAPDDPRVETIHGDRADEAALAALGDGARWDAVIDNSGYLPQVVAKSVAALRECPRYLFVSSISVYTGPGFAEDDAVHPTPHPLPDAWTGETYGGLKAGCEAVVLGAGGPAPVQGQAVRPEPVEGQAVRPEPVEGQAVRPEPVEGQAVRPEPVEGRIVVRPGLIVGPHDPTDRFTYWPVRIARGGEVAAPGRPSRTVQFIDVRDLAAWMVGLAAHPRAQGVYNAAGPARPIAMEALLHACRRVADSDTRLAWLEEAFLAREKVQPWREMPLWIPESPLEAGFNDVPIARAVATGLRFRPLDETIRDTLAWAATRPADHAWKAGLTMEKEAALLAAWSAQSKEQSADTRR